jgi:hypothetical protein
MQRLLFFKIPYLDGNAKLAVEKLDGHGRSMNKFDGGCQVVTPLQKIGGSDPVSARLMTPEV